MSIIRNECDQKALNNYYRVILGLIMQNSSLSSSYRFLSGYTKAYSKKKQNIW